jgi:hypothetical protein
MASRRKNWFKQPDSILREHWPREHKLTLILLAAYLNNRWARDGIPHEEAGKAEIALGDLVSITGLLRFSNAAKRLLSVAEEVSIEIVINSSTVSIDWPKFAEYQGYSTRSLGSDSPKEVPPSAPKEKRREEKVKPTPSSFDFEMADLFAKLLRQSNPDAKPIAAVGRRNWADTCRLMRERDSLSEAKIEYAVKWVFSTANTEADCSFVVQSMQSLRKKWNEISARIIKIKNDPKNRTAAPAKEYERPEQPKVDVDFIRREITATLRRIEIGEHDMDSEKREITSLNILKRELADSGGKVDTETHARMQKIFGMA